MATLIPAGIEIPWKGLRNGAETNNDGHGFAIASKLHGMEIFKSMDYEKTFEALREAREKHGKNSVVLFHSRWGTHGEMGEFNVHPFYVGGEDSETVMVHNGVMPSKYHPSTGKKAPGTWEKAADGKGGKWIPGAVITPGDRRSDTRIFVDEFTERFCDNDNGIPSRRGGKALQSEIGSGNKLVFLSIKSGEPKVRIVNSSAGVFKDGVWYSNNGFEYSCGGGWGNYRGGYTGSRYNSLWDDDVYVGSQRQVDKEFVSTRKTEKLSCPICKDDEVESHIMICSTCQWCLDCDTLYDECDCFYAGNEKLDGSMDFGEIEDELFRRWSDGHIDDDEYDTAWEDAWTYNRRREAVENESPMVVDSWAKSEDGVWRANVGKELVKVGDKGVHGEIVEVIDGWVRHSDGTWVPASQYDN